VSGTTIQIRRATAATATTNNVTLKSGEIGLETDTGRFKIGDGNTSWNSLAYATDANHTRPDTGLLGARAGDSPSVANVIRSTVTLDDTSYSFPARPAGVETTRRQLIVRNWGSNALQVALGYATDLYSTPSSGWVTVNPGQEAVIPATVYTVHVRPQNTGGAAIRYEVERALGVSA
jgi:hypothetical protein